MGGTCEQENVTLFGGLWRGDQHLTHAALVIDLTLPLVQLGVRRIHHKSPGCGALCDYLPSLALLHVCA